MPADYCLYSDLDGYRVSNNPPATILPELVPTTARQDIIICKDSDILLLKLTVPHNSKELIAQAQKRKSDKENYIILHATRTLGCIREKALPFSLRDWFSRPMV